MRLPEWTLQFAIVFLCIGFIIADLGYAPFVPHFTHFWHKMVTASVFPSQVLSHFPVVEKIHQFLIA